MSIRVPLLLILAAAAGVMVVGMPGFSSATFTAQTSSGATISAAADWTPPTVVMNSPGSVVAGTTTLTATASDAKSGIASVVVEYAPAAGNTWTQICSAAPGSGATYSCSWNTTTLADGAYKLRATATDTATPTSHSATSDVVDTQVTNATIVLTNPGPVLRGLVPLHAEKVNGVAYGMTIEYRRAGSGSTWTPVCTSDWWPPTSEVNCDWNTPASGSYEIRARQAYIAEYSSVITVLVDNTAPSVSMTTPAAPIIANQLFKATASDAHSGIATVELQYAREGTSAFTTMCTSTSAPYRCSFDTTSLSYGRYIFRARATDGAGNVSNSPATAGVLVDNIVASVTLQNPGATLTGTVTLTATASSTATIDSVEFQGAPGGTSSWTSVCTDNSAPYTCSVDTRMAPDGPYQVRAVLTTGGKQVISAVVPVTVSNLYAQELRSATTNVNGVVGNNDTLVFTYSGQVNLSSIAGPGWTGSSRNITVRLRNGSNPGQDELDFLPGATPVNLGSVNLGRNFVSTSAGVTYPSTMAATNVTSNGVARTVVTVRLGSPSSSSGLIDTDNTSNMVWTPSAAVTASGSGVACSTTPFTETDNDRDF